MDCAPTWPPTSRRRSSTSPPSADYAPFLRFIQTAARLNGQLINMQDVALEAEVPRTSAIHYYSLLADTMLGEYLPCWRPD